MIALLNRQMLLKLMVVAVAMFGFGWALVPLYRAICDITGINVLTKRDEEAVAFAKNTQVDKTRRITVEFDANSQGAWRFKPQAVSMDVHPGELATVVYEITNTTTQASSGQAIPSYAPEGAGKFFRKLECFCFQQQALDGGEVKSFPVVFVVDPALPKDVNTITLSYTFFQVGSGVKPANASLPAPAGG